MVQLSIALVLENPGQHGPGVHRSAGDRRVDGIVDQGGSVRAADKAAEGQIIVPRDHGKHTVLLVEVVVVDHGAGVAVEVTDKVMGHKVPDDRFDVYGIFQVFPFS